MTERKTTDPRKTHFPATDEVQPVATGQRLDETHYEAEPGEVARVRFTEKPAGPLPQDIQPRADAPPAEPEGPPVEDVAVIDPAPSVWDARPTEA